MGVDPPTAERTVSVRNAPNKKYEEAYCEDLLDKRNGPRHWKIHSLLRKQFGEAVKRFGYDLDEWPCIAEAAKLYG